MYDPAIYKALQAGELSLHYLPTVRLEDGGCLGAEALIRWRRDGRWVKPLDFMPDEQGLMALDHMARDGVRIALDDVRLNGANLALLSRCHFELIKLDQFLVQELQPGRPPPEWLRGLRALLAATSLQVVAEGVESEAQRTALVEAGVKLGQGHLFSDALPAEQFRAFFAGHAASR